MRGVNFVSLSDRFNMSYEPIPATGCWLWTGYVGSRGYGFIKQNYQTRLAHRVSYELHIKKIPDGMLVCHRCDVPSCVNPWHLFLGTSIDNNQDKANKGRCNPLHGGKHPMAKLTEEQAMAIFHSTEQRNVLAERFGISPITVSDIRKGKRWKQASKRAERKGYGA